MQRSHLEEMAAFIRQHRGSESGFEKLYAKLEHEIKKNDLYPAFRDSLSVAQAKAEEYSKARQTGGTAWPEFEKFVTEFERSVIEAIKSAA